MSLFPHDQEISAARNYEFPSTGVNNLLLAYRRETRYWKHKLIGDFYVDCTPHLRMCESVLFEHHHQLSILNL